MKGYIHMLVSFDCVQSTISIFYALFCIIAENITKRPPIAPPRCSPKIIVGGVFD